MWSIESLKNNLNRIALDVHDDEDGGELEIYASSSSVNGDDDSRRRNSHRFARSNSVSRSSLPNGTDSPPNPEIQRFIAEIKRLQESEAEIKALSVNYAALLKDKEDHISRLNQENGSLKQNLDATKEALNSARNESLRASPKQQHKSTTPGKSRYTGTQMQNGVFSKQDGVGNGIAHAAPDVFPTKGEYKSLRSPGKEKELADLLEEKNRSLASIQASHELQVKQLRAELEKEHDKLADIQVKLEEEQELNKSFQEEFMKLKTEKQHTSMEMNKMYKELDEKMSEIRQLQTGCIRAQDEDGNENVKNLKRMIVHLEKENTSLKMEKNKLETALEMSRKFPTDEITQDRNVDSSANFPKKEEMELAIQKLEKDLKETQRERDKAVQQLTRLKQHLLEKESEESEKMDEDSKIIEELRQNNEYQKTQILHLEKALKQAISSQEEVRMINNNEIQKSKEVIEDLNKKLANCMSTIDSKNIELLNLQTALGQYFAEIEAKEHLEQQLALAREESAKLSGLLNEAKQGTEASNREKEEVLGKLSHAERTVAEARSRVNKLEEDNAKLRRALEQSMTRLNRMSLDSDYLVDRRIVIKLLVTYFERNHSKEVLDLMVRMLGFSEEDKQRIGVAQQGGKSVVRGVLGLPGRLVGGILGRSSVDAHGKAASENQSFADLWVDFLLKETEERERRESMEDAQGRSPKAADVGVPVPSHISPTVDNVPGMPRSSFSSHNYSPSPPQRILQPPEHSDSEFSTVSLMDNSSRISRLLQKQ